LTVSAYPWTWPAPTSRYPGANLINILRAAFAPVDPKSVKRYWQLDWILTLLGATSVKAVRRTLMKLSPGANLTSLFRNGFFKKLDRYCFSICTYLGHSNNMWHFLALIRPTSPPCVIFYWNLIKNALYC